MKDDGFEALDTGQESYLKGVPLRLVEIRATSKEWDHEHCEFFWAKFIDPTYPDRFLEGEQAEAYRKWLAESDDDLLAAGFTNDAFGDVEAQRWWVCPECHERFARRFGW
jgi:hypothetical protein